MRDFLINMQKIDRRWVYLFVAVACIAPFLWPVKLPVLASRETQGVYNAIDKCPKDKVVLVDSAWDAGSLAENQPQVEVVFDHLLKNRTKFVVVSIGVPLGPQFAEGVIDKLVKEKYPDRVYGVDWVNLGFTTGDYLAMMQIAKNIRKQYPKDYQGTPIDNLSLMSQVHNINDIYLVYCVTYSPSESWISFINGPYGTPIAFGCAGIQSTTYYRYIDSRQLVGMLVGVRGAAEYDAHLYKKSGDRKGLGTKLIVPLAFGHLVIIIAIVVGNIGYFASRRRMV